MEVNIFLAFGAGFLSFISPCVLPLYPVFLSYITGMSVEELKNEKAMLRKRSMLHTLFFLIGFSSIFIMIGFSSYFIGEFFIRYQDLIRQLGAILIIFFGFVMIGVFNFEFLMKERKVTFKNRPSGYLGTLLIGMAFSMSWTPCTGPILGAVITLSLDDPQSAVFLMFAYSLGFSIPFFVLSFFIGKMGWLKRNSQKIAKIGGYVLIALGIALFFDWMRIFTAYLANFFGFTGF
ncbi:cytochrome c biogenesis CcdA family protein [Tenuibacillus multivorans]|uniref:Cytochrome c-type biogenesis protein n=1 Tax=Tenuibacillus multivorans TaxID=237069 RepID=A0A1H0CH80_9BACI|nr:cytochrome c biogenesis protein CcdA [Tenuibacillus multivorans]GEL76298.1 cytochrome C biogenesis protein CcdA [Tenuibacillus multivorans]SDN57192.1 cytochrome c-type biogenesis protein [Tenuibacillus multivorans]